MYRKIKIFIILTIFQVLFTEESFTKCLFFLSTRTITTLALDVSHGELQETEAPASSEAKSPTLHCTQTVEFTDLAN